jgi:hypothetical protein
LRITPRWFTRSPDGTASTFHCRAIRRDVRPRHGEVLLELLEGVGGVLGHAEEDERAVLVLPLDHLPLVREERPARRAPGAPKVYQHRLTSVVAQSDHLAVRILAGDVRTDVADPVAFDRRRLAAGLDGENADERGDGQEEDEAAGGHE